MLKFDVATYDQIFLYAFLKGVSGSMTICYHLLLVEDVWGIAGWLAAGSVEKSLPSEADKLDS
jgi:hypothetical protein